MRSLRALWLALGAAAFVFVPAFAQDQPAAAATPAAETAPATEEKADEGPSTWGAGIFVGFIAGDEISDISFDGATPELDDAVVFGGKVYFRMSDRWRLDTRLGIAPTKALNTPKGDIDATLYYIDFAFVPIFGKGRFTWGIPFGAGWSTLQDDEPFSEIGAVPGAGISEALAGGSGVHYFLGLQGHVKLAGRMSVFADARAVRFHRLQNVVERTAKGFEATAGVTWDF